MDAATTPTPTASPPTLGEQAGAYTDLITTALRDAEDYLGRVTRRWDPAEPGSLRHLASDALQLRGATARLEGLLDLAVGDLERRPPERHALTCPAARGGIQCSCGSPAPPVGFEVEA